MGTLAQDYLRQMSGVELRPETREEIAKIKQKQSESVNENDEKIAKLKAYIEKLDTNLKALRAKYDVLAKQEDDLEAKQKVAYGKEGSGGDTYKKIAAKKAPISDKVDVLYKKMEVLRDKKEQRELQLGKLSNKGKPGVSSDVKKLAQLKKAWVAANKDYKEKMIKHRALDKRHEELLNKAEKDGGDREDSEYATDLIRLQDEMDDLMKKEVQPAFAKSNAIADEYEALRKKISKKESCERY